MDFSAQKNPGLNILRKNGLNSQPPLFSPNRHRRIRCRSERLRASHVVSAFGRPLEQEIERRLLKCPRAGWRGVDGR